MWRNCRPRACSRSSNDIVLAEARCAAEAELDLDRAGNDTLNGFARWQNEAELPRYSTSARPKSIPQAMDSLHRAEETVIGPSGAGKLSAVVVASAGCDLFESLVTVGENGGCAR